MAENTIPISSAVVLPDSEPTRSPPTKRRRSSASDLGSKRARLSQDSSANSPNLKQQPPNATVPTNHAADEKKDGPARDRQKSSIQEEKKRGQRLFGGLLSTLSQSTPISQQKRRLEIEKRQQEKVKQQKAADETNRAKTLAHIKSVRGVEQIKFQEQAMRTRHSNLLAMAHFLCTKAEPKLYYKPWELLPGDEDRIKQQISDTEALIAREVSDFNRLHPRAIKSEPEQSKTNNTSKETVGEKRAESPSVTSNIVNSTNSSPQALHSERAKVEKQSVEENPGEVMVENDEDTVIF